ncbi:hypothetical protein HPB50_026475 [Hyalomma asiaticum]|uniref:Uncharacterized protein n=1 Tax=Hyalomma asiaticum TaxID=266040 RepID=A0ACB7T2R7_HYAAI|nr:hypothetical protein HPB50_026475 [Hyalomma asiaticum]
MFKFRLKEFTLCRRRLHRSRHRHDPKRTMLQRLEASDQSRLQQLLSHNEFGDQRPSQLFHQMGQQASSTNNLCG